MNNVAGSELIGARFGQLVVVAEPDSSRRRLVDCRCDCGTLAKLRLDHVRSGNTSSCGCGRDPFKHGHCSGPRRTLTWFTWSAMLARCTNVRHADFSNYGGRGITVCDRWRAGFANFLADMGEKPLGRSIDRIDNDLLIDSYSKSNCRWATQKEQCRNRRTTKLTSALVQEINDRCGRGESQISVARHMRISGSVVSEIRNGKAWADQLGGPT